MDDVVEIRFLRYIINKRIKQLREIRKGLPTLRELRQHKQKIHPAKKHVEGRIAELERLKRHLSYPLGESYAHPQKDEIKPDLQKIKR